MEVIEKLYPTTFLSEITELLSSMVMEVPSLIKIGEYIIHVDYFHFTPEAMGFSQVVSAHSSNHTGNEHEFWM